MSENNPNPDPMADLTARQEALNARETALTERENALHQRVGAAPSAGGPGPVQSGPEQYLERMRERMYEDPAAATLQIVADAMAQQEARMKPLLVPAAQQQVVQALGNGLGQPGQQYLRQAAEQFGITDINAVNKGQQDMLTRAARDFEREAIAANPALGPGVPAMSPEAGYSREAATVTAEDRKLFGEHIDRIGTERFLEMKKEAGGGDPLAGLMD